MIRTLVISEKDLTGDGGTELRNLRAQAVAEGYVEGRYRLTAEPQDAEVRRLLQGGMLQLVVFNTHDPGSFCGVNGEQFNRGAVSGPHAKHLLADWIERGRA